MTHEHETAFLHSMGIQGPKVQKMTSGSSVLLIAEAHEIAMERGRIKHMLGR